MMIEVGQVYQDVRLLAVNAVAPEFACYEVVAVRRRDATLKRLGDGLQKVVPLAKLASARFHFVRGPLDG
jgi:hypothetical protein